MKDPSPDPTTGKSIADYIEVTDPFSMISEEKRKYATKRDPGLFIHTVLKAPTKIYHPKRERGIWIGR